MTTSVLIALFGLACTVLMQAAGLLIWGAGLSQRVRQLESELELLKALPERLARIEVRLDGLLEQLKDLNSSLRWAREPGDLSRHSRD